MGQSVIRAQSLSKKYRIGHVGGSRQLRDVLEAAIKAPWRVFRRQSQDTFWALKNVSMEVRQGEVLGLVGRNGAGKTTLLKILSRITRPTSGFAEIHGRLGSLLEVGTGFHPELTGRENVYLSGAILGMSRKEIARKFDEIVAFAEVEKFIDTAFKHYSTGMQMRLAFAVAAHLEPEILLVDEVLAVGDARFQKKCLGKMGEVASGGRTIVFVSHQMNQIRRLCSKAMWIDAGEVVRIGPTAEVVSAYEASMSAGQAARTARPGAPSFKVRFRKWEISNTDGEATNILSSIGPVTVRFSVEVAHAVQRGHHGIALFNADHQLIWGWAVDDLDLPPGIHDLDFSFPMLPLRPGPYFWQVSFWDDSSLLDMWDCIPEMIVATENYQHVRDEWNGVLNLPCSFSSNARARLRVESASNF